MNQPTSSTQYMILHYSYTPTLHYQHAGFIQKTGEYYPGRLYQAELPASPRSESEISNTENRKYPSTLIGPTRFFYCLFILLYFTYSWGGSSNRNLKLEIVNWLLNHLGNVIHQTGWLAMAWSIYSFNKLKKVYQQVLSNH